MSDTTWSAKASDETKERLAQLLESSGLDTQKSFLEDMVRVYELHQAKSMVPIIGADLDELQQLTNRINSIFVGIGERINTLITTKDQDHQVEIDKKQGIIETIQGRIDQLVSERDEAETNYRALVEDTKAKEKQLVDLRTDMERQVNQLTEVNQSNKDLIQQYKDKVDTLTGIVQEYQEAKEENGHLHRLLSEAQRDLDNLKRDFATQQAANSALREQMSAAENFHKEALARANDRAELEKEKALLALKTEHQSRVQELQEQYNHKVQELLERLEGRENDDEK